MHNNYGFTRAVKWAFSPWLVLGSRLPAVAMTPLHAPPAARGGVKYEVTLRGK